MSSSDSVILHWTLKSIYPFDKNIQSVIIMESNIKPKEEDMKKLTALLLTVVFIEINTYYELN